MDFQLSWSQAYNKYIVGASAFGAFGAMIYTINRKTKGELTPNIQKILANPRGAAMDPKLAAYMFAGRAFAIGTGLTITATAAVLSGVAMYMGVDNVKDFSIGVRKWAHNALPILHQSGVEMGQETDETLDTDTLDMINQVQQDLSRETSEMAKVQESIRNDIQNRLGMNKQ